MRRFQKPSDIQQFLNKLKYRREGGARSPLVVERTRLANCFDGAVYAAAALEAIGHPPLIVDLAAKNDDDHVIAVYRLGGWGAIAKSNTTLLRSREPVYRSLRELVMSYFDSYFNTRGVRCLRSYSAPVNLRRFDAISWRTTERPWTRSRTGSTMSGIIRSSPGRCSAPCRRPNRMRCVPASSFPTGADFSNPNRQHPCWKFRCAPCGKPLLCTLPADAMEELVCDFWLA